MRFIPAIIFVWISLGLSPAVQAPPTGHPLENATFSAGCFWGVEAAFRKLPGVVATTAGYTGGHTANPTYRDVYGGNTGHVEAVEVTFDPAKVSYAELLDAFWTCHDPTADLGADLEQAPHHSAIFFHNARQEEVARASLKEVQDSGVFPGPIVTRLESAQTFYPAESFHQHYLERQHIAESCHVGIARVHTKLAGAAISQRQAKRSA
jgi:peptide-methionine (S)-S-oxide reductase